MFDALILRLEAPLMAFGGPKIDQIGRTRRFPGLSQITGLLGNALGYDHADADRLDRLQERLRFASLLLVKGRELIDYQTVCLGQSHLVDTGWTTRGEREERGKGEATSTTHIRTRHYRVGSIVLVALALSPPEEAPDLAALAAALDRPARPLFIGRKCCLPSGPLFVGRVEATGLEGALRAGCKLDGAWGLGDRLFTHDGFRAELPATAGDAPHTLKRLVDRRDWRNQFHGGERLVKDVRLTLASENSS